MEKAERKQKLLVLLGLLGTIELGLADQVVQAGKIGLDSSRRLSGDFDSALQEGDREVRMRSGGQPQAEIRMGILGVEAFNKLLQLVHPTDHEMAVGEEHPVSVANTLFQVAIRDCF